MTDKKLGKGAVALISALTMAGPVAFLPLPASAYVFSNVRIEGNQRIEPATILSTAGVQRGEDLSAGDLNDAQQRLQDASSKLVLHGVGDQIKRVLEISGLGSFFELSDQAAS